LRLNSAGAGVMQPITALVLNTSHLSYKAIFFLGKDTQIYIAPHICLNNTLSGN